MQLIDFDGLFDEKLTVYMEEKKNKFTEKQWEVYKKYNLPSHPHFNAGVCFDFIYDGKGIWFDFMPMMKASRRYISFDVYENDRFVYTFTNFKFSEPILQI